MSRRRRRIRLTNRAEHLDCRIGKSSTLLGLLALALLFPVQVRAFTAIDGMFDMNPWTHAALLALLLFGCLLSCSLLGYLLRRGGLADFIAMVIVVALSGFFLLLPLWILVLGLTSQRNQTPSLYLSLLAIVVWRTLIEIIKKRSELRSRKHD